MSQLKGLKSEGTKIVLDSNFRNGTQESVIEAIDVIDDLGLGRSIRLEPVRTVIEKAMMISPRDKSDPLAGLRVFTRLYDSAAAKLRTSGFGTI